MLQRVLFLASYLSLPPPARERGGFPAPRDGLREILLFFISLILVPSTVYASDDITLDYGAGENIGPCGPCYYVYNGFSGAPSEYIPNSCAEWQSFYQGGALEGQSFSPCTAPPSPPPYYSPPPSGGGDGGGSDGGGGDGGDG